MGVITFIWDGQNVLAEADSPSVFTSMQTVEPEPYGRLVSVRTASATLFHHFDAAGSTRQLTTQLAAVSDSLTYDAWGLVVSRSGSTTIEYQWLGEYGYYFNSIVSGFEVR